MAFTAGAKLAIVLVSVGALCLVVSGLMSLEHAHGLPVTTWITKQAKIVWEWLRDDLYCVFVEFLGELTILVACWVVAGVSGSFSPDRSMGPLAFIPPICLSVSTISFLVRFWLVLQDKINIYRTGGTFRKALDYKTFCISLFFGLVSLVCSSLMYAFTCIDETTPAPKRCQYFIDQKLPHHHDRRNWGNLTGLALDVASLLWTLFSYLWNEQRSRNI